MKAACGSEKNPLLSPESTEPGGEGSVTAAPGSRRHISIATGSSLGLPLCLSPLYLSSLCLSWGTAGQGFPQGWTWADRHDPCCSERGWGCFSRFPKCRRDAWSCQLLWLRVEPISDLLCKWTEFISFPDRFYVSFQSCSGKWPLYKLSEEEGNFPEGDRESTLKVKCAGWVHIMSGMAWVSFLNVGLKDSLLMRKVSTGRWLFTVTVLTPYSPSLIFIRIFRPNWVSSNNSLNKLPDEDEDELPLTGQKLSNMLWQSFNKRFDKFEQSFQNILSTQRELTETQAADHKRRIHATETSVWTAARKIKSCGPGSRILKGDPGATI